jgi:acetyl-CoA carboxylase biotin carboxyl carrier protein
MTERPDPQNDPDLSGHTCNGAPTSGTRRVTLLDEPGRTKSIGQGTSRPPSARVLAAPSARAQGDTAPDPLDGDLDSVCESVARLAATAGRAPSRIRLQVGLTSVEVEWPETVAPAATATATATATAAAAAAAAVDRPADRADGPAGLAHVCAPTVGTFYHRPSPDAEPFVRPGDHVTVGQPVGVIEVMKMMSTITADVAGRVTDVLVPDGHPVEFGERLVALDTTPEAG